MPRQTRAGSEPRLMQRHRHVDTLVRLAADGDGDAWEELVRRFDPAVRAIARSFRMSATDQDEVSQNTWLSLLRHIGAIRDPDAVGGWLATTARNESLRLLTGRREVAVGDCVDRACEGDGAPDEQLEREERIDALHRALQALPAHQRALMWTLVSQPALGYAQIGDALGIPKGSIGPTRQRSLARLRRDPRLLRALQT